MTTLQIGPYEVLAKLGEGGMGEVYRARDTKLHRDIALKILPEAFASDPERRARFAREARTLASLNHPHIAQIYGFEESTSGPQDSRAMSALAMELVEGEDLAARIARGPIPYDESMAMARQIGEALAAAHEQGIIHRDLKPGNIKVRDDGTIKVLDFGLAKALDPMIADGSARLSSLAHSPTITSPAAMTLGGVILGTAAYMSPEQAKGRAVDKRADIWAFGCVLYEMLTGRRAFPGTDVTDTLASVLKSDVDWTGVPPSAVRLLKKCLDKDPRTRLHDIADAWDLIDQPVSATTATPRRQWTPWVLSGLLLVSTVVLAVLYFSADATPTVVRFQIAPPRDHTFGFNLAVSPDGRRLAFSAIDDKQVTHLWLRDLDSVDARRLPGTEGVRAAFWSPDSRYLAFAAGTTLKKIEMTNGSPQTIAAVPPNSGSASWGRDDVIVFGSRGGDGVRRVPAAGGTPVPVTSLDPKRSEIAHAFPTLLPDGRHFVYFRQSGLPGLSGIYVGSLDRAPEDQDTKLLAATGSGPYILVNTRSGARLLFVREQTLLSQAFDLETHALSGEPTAIEEGLGSSGALGFASASDAVLVTRTGPALNPNAFQPTWMDRTGRALATVGEAGRFAGGRYGLALSPNGRLAAVTMTAPQSAETDLWLLEIARGILTRLTARESLDSSPVWSPDSGQVAFRSTRDGPGDVYAQRINSTAEAVALINTPESDTPSDWSPDGRFLLFVRRTNNLDDLWVLHVGEPPRTTALFETRFTEQGARFSPDGRWIAYESDESGTREIYVRPFDVSSDGKATVGTAWRVSTNGGEQVHWRRDGKELLFRDGSGAIVSAAVVAQGRELQTGLPKRLFAPTAGVPAWDVSPDGQRFLLLVPVTQPTPDPITVTLNWQQAK